MIERLTPQAEAIIARLDDPTLSLWERRRMANLLLAETNRLLGISSALTDRVRIEIARIDDEDGDASRPA